MKAPCKDCPNRHPNCHSECEDYIAYDKDNKRKCAERAERSLSRDKSPNRIARERRYKLWEMRGKK